MTGESSPHTEESNQVLKPIRKITDGQSMFVDLNAFQDDMDEETIELEWGRSSGSTILPESSSKYDIVERIERANKELELVSNPSHSLLHTATTDPAEENTTRDCCTRDIVSLRKLVHFSQTLPLTTHLLPPAEGRREADEEYEEEETAGYWSGDDVSATPEQEIQSDECDDTVISCADSQRLGVSCESAASGCGVDYWYDSEDGSSLDLSALTDSVDRLDLSPLDTDSPQESLRPFSPLKRITPRTSTKMTGDWSRGSRGKTRVWTRKQTDSRHKDDHGDTRLNRNRPEGGVDRTDRPEFKMNKWGVADNLDRWNRAPPHGTGGCCDRSAASDNEWSGRGVKMRDWPAADENKVQKRTCLSRQDQSKLPKYNGLRSEYGLSQQQLLERKRTKSERKKLRYQRRMDRQQEAEERKRANEMVFNSWLDKKRQQENRSRSGGKKNRVTTAQPRTNSAQTRSEAGRDGSKLGLLRRIMSASVGSAKERLTYSIYLGLPLNHSAPRQPPSPPHNM